jgi:hypothetical protein
MQASSSGRSGEAEQWTLLLQIPVPHPTSAFLMLLWGFGTHIPVRVAAKQRCRGTLRSVMWRGRAIPITIQVPRFRPSHDSLCRIQRSSMPPFGQLIQEERYNSGEWSRFRADGSAPEAGRVLR